MLRKIFGLLIGAHFLFASVLPGQHLYDLNRIPMLIEHYQEHQQNHPEKVSFWEFLVMHYNSNHSEQEDHSDLPLFNHSCQITFFVQPECSSVYSHPLTDGFTCLYDNYSCPVSQFLKGSVFQPPRLA
jgi:hypothetical protein